MNKKTANLWDRHKNYKAQANKKRAKANYFRKYLAEDFEKEESSLELEGSSIGIVAGIQNKNFLVMSDNNNFNCTLGDAAYSQLIVQLVVGDRVYFEKVGQDQGQILGRQGRQSVISRMRGDSTRYSAAALGQHILVANLDIAVIVASSRNPKFHPQFVDRYLVVLQNGNVKPVICINKCELTTDRHPIVSFYRESGIQIIETSIVHGTGIDELKNILRGSMSALVGNSGVGKSSLVNAIIPAANLRASEVSQKTGKGRHTTTATNLYKWDNDSYIIDTPGIRSLGIDDIEKANIRYFFPEFENFSESCKYSNCLHDHEPDCGVKRGIELGEINIYRYQSYQRMIQK